jgi:putative hydrolase of the HAD superfamily
MDIVFDFGNVLIEWNPLRLVQDHFSDMSSPATTADDFMALWMSESWAAYDRGEIDTATVAERMAESLQTQVSPLLAFIEKIPHVLAPISPSIEALERLFAARDKGASIRVFYLSNMPREFADVLETRFTWLDRFNGGIFSGREQVAKPDAVIYAALESRYSLNPGRTLFFDDVPANTDAAQRRGWLAVQVKTHHDIALALQTHCPAW